MPQLETAIEAAWKTATASPPHHGETRRCDRHIGRTSIQADALWRKEDSGGDWHVNHVGERRGRDSGLSAFKDMNAKRRPQRERLVGDRFGQANSLGLG